MDLSVVNMGGLDIVDGNQKLLLAFMWCATRASGAARALCAI